MRYELLGPTGLRVSELCLGTMSMGDQWGFGADEATSLEVIDRFGKAGGNFLDTANKYHEGQTEEIVGKAIAADRDYWVVATKYTLSTRGDDPNAAGNSRKNLRRSIEASLKRLGTDHVDLLWVHAWDFTTSIEEVMRGLDDLLRSGKALYVAISDAPAWVVARANTYAAMAGLTPFCAIQVQYSLVERTVERELLPMANALGLGVTAWAPIARGILTGKYTRGGGPGDSKRAALNEERLDERQLTIAREVDAIADELGCSSAQVATRWVRDRGAKVLPIVGVRKPSQLDDLLGSLDVELGREHIERLDAVSAIELGFPHDFLKEEGIREILYGELYPKLNLPGVPRS